MLKRISATLLVLALAAFSANVALAHESRPVGEYTLVVGFIVEPAFEGIKNGIDLRVTNTDSQAPVEGLEETIEAELTHAASDVSRVMALRTIF
ncbi:MAG: hypothetical protein ACRDIB_13140, partial [Ardenticatenaceae bacterium]